MKKIYQDKKEQKKTTMAPSNQQDEELEGPNFAQILKAALLEALSDHTVIASLQDAFKCTNKIGTGTNKTEDPEENNSTEHDIEVQKENCNQPHNEQDKAEKATLPSINSLIATLKLRGHFQHKIATYRSHYKQHQHKTQTENRKESNKESSKHSKVKKTNFTLRKPRVRHKSTNLLNKHCNTS